MEQLYFEHFFTSGAHAQFGTSPHLSAIELLGFMGELQGQIDELRNGLPVRVAQILRILETQHNVANRAIGVLAGNSADLVISRISSERPRSGYIWEQDVGKVLKLKSDEVVSQLLTLMAEIRLLIDTHNTMEQLEEQRRMSEQQQQHSVSILNGQ